MGKMAVTEEFRNILRRNKRRFGEEIGEPMAYNEAVEKGIKPYRKRRKGICLSNDMYF